ncbi:MAG: alkaline phosphatase family protein [Ardenticatenaceae bacterium]|nr:alkaline phosphatase family protein [Ardenticatenaceae bacterium]MCB8949563.1 alkaline phosphatase family protein [Ardenticatenaceae bacterium]
MKRVILFVIDALTGPLLQEEMANGRYPNFQKLQAAGKMFEQCVSIFPSITHAALTSIATGQYPVQHGVVGSHWYDVDREKVVYFSGSLGMVLQKGMGNFFREFLLDLNNEHLEALTIFQQLEREGLDTACINFPLYRGDVEHKVNMPLLLKLLPGLPNDTVVKGPKKLILGDLLTNPNDLDIEASFTGVAHWFGFRDENTIDLVLQLAKCDEFPNFTLAYFPENDYRAHDHGPVEAHHHLDDLDDMLGELFNIYGGIDSFLAQFALVITGDHSQSGTAENSAEEGINLQEVIASHKMAKAGQPWCSEEEIMPCPNLRASQLYFKNPTPTKIMDVTNELLADARTDQVIYKAAFVDEGEGYIVHQGNQRLHFWRALKEATSDLYGNLWQWEGDLGVVDGRIQDDMLVFHDYPNAFERIAGVLDAADSGQIWSTAKLGHEIYVPPMKLYTNGGSHASLHRLDSQPPLLLAGIPEGVPIPQYPRIVDVAPLCRACLQQDG